MPARSTPELTATEVVDRAPAHRPVEMPATPWTETGDRLRRD
ncbi:hypothetical protein ABZ436_06165 [Micromonospora matsumotoense]